MKKKTFEESLQNLELLVRRLEEEDLSLEESLKAFEEGVKLSKFCAKKLDEAQQKVEILLKDQDDNLQPAPLEITERGEEEI